MDFVVRLWTVVLFFTGGISAATIVTTLTLENAVVSPDGFNRSAIVINGSLTAPVITGNKGDHFKITIQNLLTDASMNRSTSVHWHGIVQHHNNAMDGTAFVTQCPIAPNHSFQYHFSSGGQSGTFWYHSHFRRQLCEGLRGALVLYDPDDPYQMLYDVDDLSTIIALTDWYHQNAYKLTGIAVPKTLLVNGVGRYPGGPASPLAVINVTQGKRYRIRLLNMACGASYVFSIDNHVFTVIEADGNPTLPLVVDSIPIATAQRYSFVLEANQPVDNYWIRGNLSEDVTSFDNGLNSAILRYSGAPIADPPTRNWTPVNELAEYNLHAVDMTVPGIPGVGNADVNLNIVAEYNRSFVLWDINGVSYVSPQTPVLLQILSGASASELVPQNSIYALPANKVVEVSFPGALLASSHPFHLHGHRFHVVRSAGTREYNYVNPVRRDTVTSGTPNDNVTIRFVTDNAGPWFLHCHIDVHLDLGMAIVFAEDMQHAAVSHRKKGQGKELCDIYDALPPSEQ